MCLRQKRWRIWRRWRLLCWHCFGMELQRRVRQVYLDAAEYDERMHVIDCCDEELNMAAPEQIFAKIKAIVNQYINPTE